MSSSTQQTRLLEVISQAPAIPVIVNRPGIAGGSNS